MAHTPQPWTWITPTCKGGHTRRELVSPSRHLMVSMRVLDEEDVANQQVLAAAPELLAALEYCAELVNLYLEKDPMWEGNLPGSTAIERMRQARAAIAKAKGLN